MEEGSRLFEQNLEPLFNLLATTGGSEVLQKISGSLKKALLLMAMKRYAGDPASICQVLGITRQHWNMRSTPAGSPWRGRWLIEEQGFPPTTWRR